MAQNSSPETQSEALNIAKATQKPGQTKEQTKLIAQGVQKGIDLYKKQQKAKARERDKLKKKEQKQKLKAEDNIQTPTINEPEEVKQHWLPWVLLLASWVGFFFIYPK
ncbi:DUF2956 domain-containing protein [Vibrio sp. SS-MA-C1-2]|uniref:DUF2956 domain-containing protein n=1 Tax=Vibrio sp. SS-MA-C1-2 TaxID=2908646 RepID=UPI001F21C5DD|nr:DUF2956 domain-containing protein [Vibrio sp. SS-MA-C1-2]UJF19794.1 DUF2956 domain-containing protein [Vibrio sp. SS-MA-C1-2]